MNNTDYGLLATLITALVMLAAVSFVVAFFFLAPSTGVLSAWGKVGIGWLLLADAATLAVCAVREWRR